MAAKSHHINRRQAILEEASTLFARYGYEGTSIRNIAGACEITEAAIYRHYRSKSHLFEEVIRAKAGEHDIRSFLQSMDLSVDLEKILHAVANHILTITDRDPDLMRLISFSCLGSGQGSTTLFQEVRLPYIEFLTDELGKRIERNEVDAVDPFITSRCFVGMVMDCAINTGVWTRISDKNLSAEDVVCNNVPIFARGLMVRGSHQAT